MSDSEGNSESQALKGWTLVSSQGEFMSEDGDSESSESSIEIISVENNEIVSSRSCGASRSVEDEVVVEANPPSASLTLTENLELELNNEERKDAVSTFSSVPSAENNTTSSVTDSVNTHAELPETKPLITNDAISTDKIMQPADVDTAVREPVEGDIANQCTSESGISVTMDATVDDSRDSIELITAEDDEGATSESGQDSDNSMVKSFSSDTSGNVTQAPESWNEVQLQGDQAVQGDDEDFRTAVSGNAAEDDLEGHAAQSLPDAGKQSPSPTPVSQEEAELSQLSGEGAAANVTSKSDSDTDSDFVRLDSDNIETYEGRHEHSEERVMIPLRLYRTGSSIGPGFSFLRDGNAESADRHSPNREYDAVEDEDRDDDTESSAEEGVDDRIESEQSEAGSFSVQNDVGDLSAFADIGDLPLEAGNVPRNYIHQPNNHLSTVLNIIVVLAAILTMGISLGIIMATDLEIEEWQNAHELQVRKVKQLELQLQGKSRALEMQVKRVREMEPMLLNMKNTITTLEQRANGYEGALDALAAYTPLEGGNVGKAVQLVKDAATDYVNCVEVSSQSDCHLKLVPYFNTYTELLLVDTSVVQPQNTPKKYAKNVKRLNNILSDSVGEEPVFFDNVKDFKDHEINSEMKGEDQRKQMGSDEDNNFPRVHQARAKEEAELEETDEQEVVHFSPYTDHPSTEKVQASPILLDLKQLQQSLTREQERAVHWQQLYLAERRQREKEREEEEWEDEREREMHEREKEQVDQVECLRRLMATNLTTLTQHVAKWNVSVFDDFANLSMLLSGVAELKQAVVDSLHKVWEGAGEAIGNMQNKGKNEEGTNWGDSIPHKEKVVEYLTVLLEHVKRGYLPDKDTVVNSLSRILNQIKDGAENVFSEVNSGFIGSSVKKIWEEAEAVMHKLEGDKEKVTEEQEETRSIPDQQVLVEYLARVLNDIKHGVEDVLDEVHSQDHKTFAEHENEARYEYPELVDDGENKEDIPSHDNKHTFFSEEQGNSNHGFWSKKIGKILKRTSKSVRKLGRKVASTWNKIKIVWHERKPTWHKVKTLWQETKPGIFNLARKFTSKVTQASSKSTHLCTKLPKHCSRNWEEMKPLEVDIHSRCVHGLREQWKKMVLDDPCRTLGKFSYECNAGRKQRKLDKKIFHAFNQLLSIPSFEVREVFKLNVNDMLITLEKFRNFQYTWGQSKLLLKTDQTWVQCQIKWWTLVLDQFDDNIRVEKLKENTCDTIKLEDNFYEGHFGDIHCRDIGYGQEYAKGSVDYNSGPEDPEFEEFDSPDKGAHKTVLGYVNYVSDHGNVLPDDDKDDDDENERIDKAHDHTRKNETESQQHDSVDWYLERARYRLQLRREKAKADWVFELAAERQKQRNHPWYQDGTGMKESSMRWMFEKAKNREYLRKENHKSDWLYKRSGHHTANSRGEEMDNEKEYFRHGFHKRHGKRSGSWFMEHGEDRQRQREMERKSDWLFERAADRRDGRRHGHHSGCKKQHHSHHKQRKHGKQFRHAYGKVST